MSPVCALHLCVMAASHIKVTSQEISETLQKKYGRHCSSGAS